MVSKLLILHLVLLHHKILLLHLILPKAHLIQKIVSRMVNFFLNLLILLRLSNTQILLLLLLNLNIFSRIQRHDIFWGLILGILVKILILGLILYLKHLSLGNLLNGLLINRRLRILICKLSILLNLGCLVVNLRLFVEI